MIKKSNALVAAALFLCGAASLCAQEFKVRAPLSPVGATGFYKILVTPELSAYAKSDLSDIRLTAAGGGNTAYLINTRVADLRDTGRESNMLVAGSETEKNTTTVVLQTTKAAMVNGIALVMNNTAAERFATVSGSNDNVKWYIIDDHVLLHSSAGNADGTFVQDIYLPPNKYRYFKLKINNAHTDPLNIIGARAIHNPGSAPQVQLQENPAPTVTHLDSSNHCSYITIRNHAPYLVNGLRVNAVGARFFERTATMYIMATDNDSAALSYPVATFTISSSTPGQLVTIAGQKAKNIVLQIENKDDAPLKIAAATTWQEKQFLVSWLEQGKQYSVIAGSDNAAAPHYDLSKFRDSIPTVLPELQLGNFTAITATSAVVVQKEASRGYWLWLVIIGSVGVLSLLTYKLMKDIKKTNDA